MPRMLRRLLAAAVLLAPLAVLPIVSAQTFPSKPIRIVSPYAPGGLGDIFPRGLAGVLSEQLGRSVFVDNRPGASQIIGAVAVAKAPADGYTLLFGSVTSLAINVSTQRNLPYDPLKDFEAVTLCFSTPMYLVTRLGLAANTVPELIALGRATARKLTYASIGPGSSTHLAAEMFTSLTGMQLVHVPYKGAGPAMLDVIAGTIDLMFEGSAINYAREGKVRALATTGLRRARIAPEVPTLQEAGVPGYDATLWFGVTAPAGTPRTIVDTLAREITKALENPILRERFSHVEFSSTGPEAFAALIRSEIPKYRKIVTDAKLTLE